MGIKAIDVSSWQHPNGAAIDWRAVIEAGYQAAFIKCSQGIDYTNPFFRTDADAANAAGLIVGAYHFAQPAKNPAAAEVAFAVGACAGVNLALGLALDWEDLGGGNAFELSEWAHDFVTAAAEHFALVPFYTDQSLYAQTTGAPWGHPLWIADPSGTFEGTCWAKQTGRAAVAGIVGETDVDDLVGYRPINPGGSGELPVPPSPPAPPAPPPPPAEQPPATQPPAGSPPAEPWEVDVNVPELSEVADLATAVAEPAVKTLQSILGWKEGENVGTVDGIFGPRTKAAVEAFQTRTFGAGPAVDGIVGPNTWNALVNQ